MEPCQRLYRIPARQYQLSLLYLSMPLFHYRRLYVYVLILDYPHNFQLFSVICIWLSVYRVTASHFLPQFCPVFHLSLDELLHSAEAFAKTTAVIIKTVVFYLFWILSCWLHLMLPLVSIQSPAAKYLVKVSPFWPCFQTALNSVDQFQPTGQFNLMCGLSDTTKSILSALLLCINTQQSSSCMSTGKLLYFCVTSVDIFMSIV